MVDTSILESFIWSFLGIVVESLPFIIIGSLVSAIIQVFLTEELIRKFIFIIDAEILPFCLFLGQI